MKRFIKTILLASVIATMLPTIMQADTYEAPPKSIKVDYQVLADQISAKYAVPASTVKKIISCESNWNTTAARINTREHSVGLVQINLKAHTDITQAQAEDPEFAISYLAQNIKDGNGPTMWYTCSK